MEAQDFRLGASFRWVSEVYRGDNEILCRMKLPGEFPGALDFELHPGLIGVKDITLQGNGMFRVTNAGQHVVVELITFRKNSELIGRHKKLENWVDIKDL